MWHVIVSESLGWMGVRRVAELEAEYSHVEENYSNIIDIYNEFNIIFSSPCDFLVNVEYYMTALLFSLRNGRRCLRNASFLPLFHSCKLKSSSNLYPIYIWFMVITATKRFIILRYRQWFEQRTRFIGQHITYKTLKCKAYWCTDLFFAADFNY